MADYFPEEVLLEVLASLPVKTVLQCTTVCKTWRSLITAPDFTIHHLNNYSQKNNFVLLRYCTPLPENDFVLRYCTPLPGNNGKEHYFLYSDDEGFLGSPVTQFTCPIRTASRGYNIDIVGSVNGLLCLSNNALVHTDTFVIWNPSVRKHVVTPKPSVIYKTHGPHTQLHGFGFDDVRSDYKLVRIVYVGYYYDKVPPFVEVYSLKSRGWRLVENDLNYVIFERQSSVFVNGMSHWLAHAPDGSQIGVVPFAFGSESFGKMMAVPGSLDWEDYINMSVAVCNGLLALVPYKRCPVKDCYSVWVMKEYGDVGSWSKLYTFQQCEISRVVAFRKDEQIVLTKADGDRPVSCSFEGDLLVTLDMQTNAEWSPNRKHWGPVGSFYVDRFLESLVLLGEPDVASDEKEDVEDKTTAASTESSSDSGNGEGSLISLLNALLDANLDFAEYSVNALLQY